MGFRMTRRDIEAVRRAKASPPTRAERPALPRRVFAGIIDGGSGRAVELSVTLQEGKGHIRVAADLAHSAKDAPKRIEEALVVVNYAPPDHCDALISIAGLSGALLSRAAELPIALAVAQHLGATLPRGCLAHGGLQRDGSVVPLPGGVAAALAAKGEGVAWMGHTRTAEKAAVTGGNLYLADCLTTALSGGFPYYPEDASPPPDIAVDFAGIIGQDAAKFAVEVAAAGGHHLILGGPPGEGKSLLAKALVGILPPLTTRERLELVLLREAHAKLSATNGHVRPFVEVGRGVTLQAMIGGGTAGEVWPGLVTDAHRGVLMVDEFPLLSPSCLEALRVPLEHGYSEVQRSGVSARFPANFALAAAMNPCPCGPEEAGCICTTTLKRSYRRRMSGPVYDRIDIRATVEPIRYNDMTAAPPSEDTATILARILAARDRQHARYRGEAWHVNADLPHDRRDDYALRDDRAETLLVNANPTPRRTDRVLRIARTIADLRSHDTIIGDDMHDALGITEGGSRLCAEI